MRGKLNGHIVVLLPGRAQRRRSYIVEEGIGRRGIAAYKLNLTNYKFVPAINAGLRNLADWKKLDVLFVTSQ